MLKTTFKSMLLRQRAVTTLLLSLLVVGASSAHAHPSVEDAWIRLLPANAKMTSAYANINTVHADKLLSVSSERFAKIEMHETSMVDGMMNMRPVDGIELAENQGAKLQPQGKHLMLMGIKQPLTEGEIIPLTFELEQSGSMTFDFEVRKP